MSANLARDVDLRTRRDMDDEGRHGLIPAPWAATCFGPPRDWAVSRRRRRARDRRIWTSTDCSRGSRPRIAQVNNLGERQFTRLGKLAKVKRITFHGMRHTCATLLLQAGEPIHVVSKRLGHARVEITLNTYAHVLPDMQKQAAATMGALLHG